MFQLTRIFSNEENALKVTPVLMNGEPMFFPKELEEQLEYSNLSHSIVNSVGMVENIDYAIIKGDKLKELKQLSESSITAFAISPNQNSYTLLAESGLYALILRSTKPKALQFRIWVTSEVLPEIRKTGSYSNKSIQNLIPDEIASRKLKAHLEMASMLKVPEHIGAIEAVKVVKKDTGIDCEPLLLQSPIMDNIKPEEEMLEPTELSKLMRLSPRTMNRFLVQCGLQEKVSGRWTPTKNGEQYSMKHAWTKGTKSGYNYKWNVSAILTKWRQALYS